MNSSTTSKSFGNKSAAIGFLRFHGLGMSKILPRLYLSGEDVVKSRKTLKDNNITHILNLTTNVENVFEPDLVYKRIKIDDSALQDMTQCFEESFDFIEKALNGNENNAVLVHCNAGVSRSASVIIGYLMKTNFQNSYCDAYNFVLTCRPAISPNPGFVRQLKLLENRLKN